MIFLMKNIKKTIAFNCSIQDLYDCLINAKKLSKIIGGKVSNPGQIKGKFSAYDDYIFGENVLLSPGKKIVQKWSCQDYPTGQFSNLTIVFKKKTDKTCEIDFSLDNVPDDLYEDIGVLWDEMFFEPIKDYLEDLMWK
jgi:activator of HSP90 ATPase